MVKKHTDLSTKTLMFTRANIALDCV